MYGLGSQTLVRPHPGLNMSFCGDRHLHGFSTQHHVTTGIVETYRILKKKTKEHTVTLYGAFTCIREMLQYVMG